MELELGLKITQTREDLTADVRIAKTGGGFVFLSRETEAGFILTAHLRGYRAKDIYIKINEDGTQISIIGIGGIEKVFRIPEGVVLDRIKAKFNEEDSVLTISMPKSVKGISRSAVEEIVASAESEKTGETKQTEENTEEESQETEQQVVGERETVENEEPSGRRKKCKVNVPAVAGSAILVSVLVLVVNLVRTRHK